MAADAVGDGQPEGHRWIACATREERQPAERLGQQVLARLVPPRALGAVAADGRVDDARIEPANGLVVEAHSFHHTGTEVVGHHVRLDDESLHQLEVVGVLEVGSEGGLVAVDGMSHEAVAVDVHVPGRHRATGLALPGSLDLDDRGAHVGEAQAGPGPSHVLGELEDQQALKGSAHAPALRDSRYMRSSVAITERGSPPSIMNSRMGTPPPSRSWKARLPG